MRHDMAGVYPPPRPAPFLAEGGEHRGGRDKQAPNLQTKTLSPRMVGAGGDEWNDRDSASELHGWQTQRRLDGLRRQQPRSNIRGSSGNRGAGMACDEAWQELIPTKKENGL